MVTVIPEILLIVVEFPITIALTWVALCWNMTGGYFSFLFFLILWPVVLLCSLLAYLFLHSRYVSGSATLPSTHKGWIEFVDPALKVWEGKKLPIREAYEWYFQGKINFTKPLLEVFLHRFNLF
jgi:hypothetical protein